MHKRLFVLLPLIMCAAAANAAAQTATGTISASVSSIARLSLSRTTIAFPDADPESVPHVPALPDPLLVTARTRVPRNSLVTLTVQANGDLRSGVHTLPASTIGWIGGGAGFVSGTLSRQTPQLVGSWIGSGVRQGTQSYRFQNSWLHPPGTYSVTLVYTLAIP
jgi:hypothetical protein